VALDATTKSFIDFGSGSTASKCTDGTNISASTLTPLVCQCPTYAADIAPCVCGATSGSTKTLTTSCANGGLDATDMTSIFDKIQNTTQLLVDTINLNANKLVKVPTTLLQKYPNVTSLSIASNQITAISANYLNLTANIVLIDLSNNSISGVASGAFPSKLSYLCNTASSDDFINLNFYCIHQRTTSMDPKSS
jgi:Leucine-rich repeat (LRR) protein